MTPATILLATKTVADPSWVPIVAAITSAGSASIAIAIVRGIWVRAQEQGPRARVQAIRNGAETLKLLEPGSVAYRAVQRQVLSEADALEAPRRSWWARQFDDYGSVYLDETQDGDESLGPLGVPWRPWVNTMEKRTRAAKVLATLGFIVAGLGFISTVCTFFVPGAVETRATSAVLGGAVTAVFTFLAIAFARARPLTVVEPTQIALNDTGDAGERVEVGERGQQD